MKTKANEAWKVGDTLSYDDGREGHRGVTAKILHRDNTGVTVQFADRAAKTRIQFNQKAWMDYLRKV
jgi:hypothetical protein